MKSGYKLALFLFVTNAFIDEVQAGQGLLIRSLLRTMAWTITDQCGVNGITHHRASERRSAPLSAI
jgi:hypothetical protein